MMSLEASTAPVNPAASAKGTVRPSAMPMTISRTTALASKCFSTCGVKGTLLLRGERRFQIFASIRSRGLGDLLGRALGDDKAASVSSLGAQVDHPIGAANHFQIVFDNQDARAQAQQPLKCVQQFCDVVEMQPSGRFIENV